MSFKFIGEYWRGEKPLWKAFWIAWLYPFVPLAFIGFLFTYLLGWYDEDDYDTRSYFFGTIIYLGGWAMTIWINTSVWRCAMNSKRIWANLARALVVISYAGIIIMDAKLAIDHGLGCLFELECFINDGE